GAALAWRESTLPPFARLLTEFSNIRTFTPGYLVELFQRFVPVQMVVAVVLVVLVYLLINRWIRTTTFVLLALIAMPIWYGTGITLPGAKAQQATAQSDGSPRAD
ncbi:MAG TPA: cellulose biosynthesis protein BcsG, partial [Cupriavidus sp.]|nr:cellulose biosynthesis protein BcsG [Cupriavidus sp.]